MKRYLLSFLAAYLAAVGVTLGLLLIGLANWLFSNTPLWFEMLCVVLVSLTVLGMGEVLGSRPKAREVKTPIRVLLVLLVVMAVLSLIIDMAESMLYVISFPGMMLGAMLQSIFEIRPQWEYLCYGIGNLLVPGLFHLGWHWGVSS